MQKSTDFLAARLLACSDSRGSLRMATEQVSTLINLVL
jgi:hypothetical protein